jgi:hypothetical protein
MCSDYLPIRIASGMATTAPMLDIVSVAIPSLILDSRKKTKRCAADLFSPYFKLLETETP